MYDILATEKTKRSFERRQTVKNDEMTLARHLIDLSRRAYSRAYYVYSEFLSPADASLLETLYRRKEVGAYTLYGGYRGAERSLAVFGSEQELGYPPSYPTVWLEITPRAPKFADLLSHRDVLGSLMALGIRREVLGDILITDNTCYLFMLESMSDYIAEHLVKVRHTDVKVRGVDSPPEIALTPPDESVYVVAGERLDAFVASVYRLSRAESADMIEKGLVAIDGRVCEKGSVTPHEGAMISLRGYGRFQYLATVGDTRKGKLRIKARVY